jgi:hypothetical protein
MEEVEKIKAELATEKAKNTALEAANDRLEAEKASLTAQLDAAKATKGSSVKSATIPLTMPQTPFTVDKAEYRFTVPSFSHNGETITATDALKDKTLLAELVKGGYGVIEKVEK